MKAKGFLLVYCPVPSLETAEEIAVHLVSLKLAACVNLLPQALSVYKWKGKVEKSKEQIMILKTKTALFPKMSEELIQKHPYECPGICAIALHSASLDFLKWIEQSLS